MQALVLVGGQGTRLRPLTETLPKPVMPLVDRPFLAYMIEWLGRHGVDEVVLACGFLPDGLREVLGDGGSGGPRLVYVEEPEPRGTAGAIKFAEEHLDDRFLALNGDVLTDLDLTALMRLPRAVRRAGHPRPLPGRRPQRLRARPPPRRWRDHRVPREARPGGDRHGRDQRRHLRARARGARPDRAGRQTSRSSATSSRGWSAAACTGSGSRATGWTSGRPSATCRRAGTSSRAGSRPTWSRPLRGLRAPRRRGRSRSVRRSARSRRRRLPDRRRRHRRGLRAARRLRDRGGRFRPRVDSCERVEVDRSGNGGGHGARQGERVSGP